MRISEFQVGDVLIHPHWNYTTYTIVDIDGEGLVLTHMGSDNRITWDGYKFLKGLMIIRNGSKMSPVEQKIAYLEHLFKNRKESL